MKLKRRQLVCLVSFIGLLSLSIRCSAGEPGSGDQGVKSLYAAASVDNEDDEEDDEEEQAVNYRDRLRELQDWMRRRDAERKHTQELDIPQATPPTLSAPFPRYFQDQGYDENGYRRLGDDVRIKLRDETEASSLPYGSRRGSSMRLMRRGYAHALGYPRRSTTHGLSRHHSGGKSRSVKKRHLRR